MRHRYRVPSLRTLSVFLLLPIVGCDRSSPVDPDPPEPPPAGCEGQDAITLGVGQSVMLEGAGAHALCIGGASTQEFVLVPSFAPSTQTATTRVTFSATGTRAVTGPPSPVPPASFTLPFESGAAGRLVEDRSFDARLRERERRELMPLIGAPTSEREMEDAATAPSGASTPSRVPEVGELIMLNAQPDAACSDPMMRAAEIMAVSERAIIAADTARPANGFTVEDFESIAIGFDTLIAPVVTRTFGEYTDLDGNGRVVLFYTPEVNRLSEEGSQFFVTGFFYARDLFPTTQQGNLQACPTSNFGEVLYLMVPDPAGTINGNVRSLDFVRRFSWSVAGHELQHLVNASRRLHTLQLQLPFEELWLNEGMSHMAEEILFFESSGLSRESNIGLAELQAGGARAIAAVNTFQVSNIARFSEFMRSPESASPYSEEDSTEQRGAAQNFLRYVVDRVPQSEEAFFRALVDNPSTGLANLAGRMGGEPTFRGWLAEWAVAVYAADRVAGVESHHQLRSWSYPSLFSALDISPYPILTRTLSSGSPLSVDLTAGGSSYIRFGIAGAEPAEVEISGGSGALPDAVRITLLRTR